MLDSTQQLIARITSFVATGKVNEEILKHEEYRQPWATPMGARALSQAHLDDFTHHLASVAHAVASRTGHRATVLTDVKSMSSIHDKLSRWHQAAVEKGLPHARGIDTMGDVLRGTILLHSPGEVAHVHDHLFHPSKKVEIKRKGEDPEFGYYGSSHYDLHTHAGITAEVQVMTHRLWEGKHVLHDIYTRYRNKDERAKADPAVVAKHMRISRLGFDALNRGSDLAAGLMLKAAPPKLPPDPSKHKEVRNPNDSRVVHVGAV